MIGRDRDHRNAQGERRAILVWRLLLELPSKVYRAQDWVDGTFVRSGHMHTRALVVKLKTRVGMPVTWTSCVAPSAAALRRCVQPAAGDTPRPTNRRPQTARPPSSHWPEETHTTKSCIPLGGLGGGSRLCELRRTHTHTPCGVGRCSETHGTVGILAPFQGVPKAVRRVFTGQQRAILDRLEHSPWDVAHARRHGQAYPPQWLGRLLRGDGRQCHPLAVGRRRDVVKDGDVSVVRERPQDIVPAGRHLEYVHDPARACKRPGARRREARRGVESKNGWGEHLPHTAWSG